MSTGTRRQHAQAEQDARDFAALFTGCFERWTIAGTVRSCPTEEEFFRLCGKPFRGPEARE